MKLSMFSFSHLIMKEPKGNRFFNVHMITGTIFVILVSYLLQMVTVNIDFFNPVTQALSDFKVTDVVYSKLKDKRPPEQEIVMVNIGNLDRAGLAAVLQRINEYEPAAVGIDAFFKRPKDPFGDSALATVFANTKNLVLVSKLDSVDSLDHFNHLVKSAEMFSFTANSGFANFVTGGDEGYLTTRKFTTLQEVGDTVEYSFTSRLLALYDPVRFKKLDARPKQLEIINYSGNLERYFKFDYPEVLDPNMDLSVIKGKIVLMGFMGEPMGEPSLTDIFFTPLNEREAGRSHPDMYGITVHANILSMMLGGYYIDQAPSWFDPLLAIVLCMLNVALFIWVGNQFRDFAQLSMRIIQIIEGTVITFIMFYLLTNHDYNVDFTLTLVLVFLTADLAEIYEGTAKTVVEQVENRLQISRSRRKRKKEIDADRALRGLQ